MPGIDLFDEVSRDTGINHLDGSERLSVMKGVNIFLEISVTTK